MRTLALAAVNLALLCCAASGQGPEGIPARPDPNGYSANAHWRNATFAASLLSTKQVEHLFAFDISKSYAVFEVAMYANGEPIRLARQAFSIKVNASGDATHNAEPDTVASSIQRQNLPPMPSSGNTTVQTTSVIGYEHGTDPYTGRKINGVYTAEQVSITHGEQPPAPGSPKAGGTFEDRQMLEAQLRARSLPEGSVEQAVAGYLYFRKSDLKTQWDGSYALEYLVDESGAGATQPLTLSVPRKAR